MGGSSAGCDGWPLCRSCVVLREKLRLVRSTPQRGVHTDQWTVSLSPRPPARLPKDSAQHTNRQHHLFKTRSNQGKARPLGHRLFECPTYFMLDPSGGNHRKGEGRKPDSSAFLVPQYKRKKKKHKSHSLLACLPSVSYGKVPTTSQRSLLKCQRQPLL